jgi:hypothetical protein
MMRLLSRQSVTGENDRGLTNPTLELEVTCYAQSSSLVYLG